VDAIFASNSSAISYLVFPSIERLQPRRTPHFGLGPILENEGTIQGTYEVIDKVFLHQLIKHADIGIIERIMARCCLLFHGSKKRKYAFLSLYMTWLTQTEASSHVLRTAILANSLVNLRGAEDGWFEMDRLNEFFNLQMKTLMATRRTSTQAPDGLFVALP
jgi:hypothetical protein